MTQLLTYFVRLCLFQSGPQDAPASEQFVIVTGLLVAVSHALTNNLYDTAYSRIIIAVSQVLVFGAVVYLVLKIKSLQSRWVQTLTALYGAAALFQFASWPLITLMDPSNGEASGFPQPLWLHLVIGGWYLAVMAHILRHALDTTMGRGIAAAIFCQLGTLFGLLLALSFLGVGESPP